MAKKKDEPHNERLFKCEKLNVKLSNMNMTPAKRDGGTYEYHDTVKVEAQLHEDDLIDVLTDMGVEKPDFLRAQSPQIWHWPLDGCKYYEHHVILKVSQKKVAEIEDATIYDFEIERAGDSQYKFVFSFKGVPAADEHRKLELVYLDAKAGKLHHLAVVPPTQGDLPLKDQEQNEPAESEA